MLERPSIFKHPFNTANGYSRLKNDYNLYGKLIVAFDFDNTIFDYHNNGGDYSQVISLLKMCSDLDFTMILFTSHDEEEKIRWMAGYCKHHGIRIDYVNSSPITKTRKPYYNILLDDRAGLESAYLQLSKLVSEILEEKRKNEKY